MLVLSRKRDQSIIIDHRIKITIVDIRGDKVRLGVFADPSIPVHREEVEKAIAQEATPNIPEARVEQPAPESEGSAA